MENRVFITLHGYKRPQWDDFHAIRNNINLPGEVIVFDYYDSTDRKQIKKEIFRDNIIKELDKYKDKKVTLIGYSVGAVAALGIAGDYDNIDQIYAITPAVKTKMIPFILKGFILPYYLMKKLVKRIKLGKEEYNKYKKAKSRGASEKYPFSMTWEIHVFKMWIKHGFNKLHNKRIKIVYAGQDGIIDVKKTSKYIRKNINTKDNQLEIEELDVAHHDILEDNSPVYPDLDQWVKRG